MKALVLKDEKDESEELKESVQQLQKSLEDQKKAFQDRLEEIKVRSYYANY